MQVDDIYEALGNPGRYHVLVTVGLLLNFWPAVFCHIIANFYNAKSRFRCKLPTQNSTYGSFSVAGFDPAYNIVSGDTNATQFEADACSVYKYDNVTGGSRDVVPCSSGYEYEADPGERTIVMEWDLVCDRAYLNSLATTIYFLGVMLGGAIFGPMADHYGRRPVLLTTLAVILAIGTGLGFVRNYIAFVVLRFIQGGFTQGLQTANFTLLSELFTPRLRAIAGNLPGLSYDVNNMVIALVCWLVRDWRNIQLAYSMPFALLLIQLWTLPESPRWLVLQKRHKQARQLFNTMASFNNVRLPEKYFTDDDSTQELQVAAKAEDNGIPTAVVENIVQKKHSVVDLFRTPVMRKRTLVLLYVSLATVMTNMGIVLCMSSLPGNKYLVFFVAAVISLPTSFTSMALLRRFGRRRPLFITLIVVTVCSTLAGVIPETEVNGVNVKWLVTVFALMARVTSTVCFLVVMVFSAELFPTVVRNIGVGTCMIFMRLGIVFASQAMLLEDYTFQQFPFVVMGVATGVASVLVLLLPDVNNSHHLPDTIQEVESSTGGTAVQSELIEEKVITSEA